jgi:hypothetical protein
VVISARHGSFLLAFGLVIATSLATATDPDLWWHLRTGDVIVNQGLPTQDIFSFTVTDHRWITHEWLSQVFLWGVWSLGGAPLLTVVFGTITVAAFFIAYRIGGGGLPVAWLTALASIAAGISTGVRPQMFNLLGMALTLLILEKVRRGVWDTARLWWLVPLIVIWANFHSGFFVGLAACAVYAVGEALERRRGSATPTMTAAQSTRVALLTVASFAAAILNPSGWRLWTYPFETLGSDAMRDFIVEWHSPNFHNPLFWPFAALLVAAVVVAATVRPPLRFTQALLLVGTGLAGLQSMRHISLFAIVAVACLGEPLTELVRSRRNARASAATPAKVAVRRGPVALIGTLSATLGILVAAVFAQAAIANNDTAVASTYPVEAVDWLETNGYQNQRGFNDYAWGGYLIWRGFDVYIDGRADVYGDEFLSEYADAFRGKAGWAEPLDRYDVDWILLDEDRGLVPVLDESNDWSRVYEDDLAVVFARTG